MSTAEYQRWWRENNPDKIRDYTRKHQVKVKQRCIDHYGGKCVCCGEVEISFLSVDHTNNDGAQHRKELLNKTGLHFYRWLIANDFLTTYSLQVLCWNCQWGKRLCGICPHQESRDE